MFCPPSYGRVVPQAAITTDWAARVVPPAGTSRNRNRSPNYEQAPVNGSQTSVVWRDRLRTFAVAPSIRLTPKLPRI